ncbi:PepSY-associated TM helix domain-containing protein [Pseudochryseolinea flava]|uniref:PepSY domain-containing protein n=1 Tax=Pseudochryseolinea flava TaxID=2059302 RepID=A0A364Y5I4_9BACT|nr:PepSY domain-containing protein [Pseudochryseolinea flava]RAW02129.1 PepSY domain-containing protein [Pseudochryseolinea flava]
MKKNRTLNQWLWKWHFIAGLVSLPVVLILSVTGFIYLFKDDYEAPRQQDIRRVAVAGKAMSFQQQLQHARKATTKKIDAMVLPTSDRQATEFISGKFSHKSSYFVDPYTGSITGSIIAHETEMNTIRKLHGELLMGKVGTLAVELIGSWLVVLILTGLYIWWPFDGFRLRGVFIPRINLGKRTFFRDLHAVTGFWLSILLLMTLAGGLPWTDVFGDNFKWVQRVTNTGYPATWDSDAVKSQPPGKRLTVDEIVSKSESLQLPGEVLIELPKDFEGVYSVSNISYEDLSLQQKIHFDQYTGKILVSHSWADVGILMRGRMWFMTFHQGQFGAWNWWLMATVALLLSVMSASAILSYVWRRRKGWDTPVVPASFKVGYAVIIALAILAVVLPMFGMSVVLLVVIVKCREYFLTTLRKHPTT